jgi:hypothetical protein
MGRYGARGHEEDTRSALPVSATSAGLRRAENTAHARGPVASSIGTASAPIMGDKRRQPPRDCCEEEV